MTAIFKYIILFAVLLGSYNLAITQTFEEDIKGVYESYRKTDQFQTNIIITVYNFKEQPVIQKAQIKKSGNNFHYFIDTRKVLMNNKYMITVNSDQKEIVVADALSKDVLNATAFGEDQMKEMLKKVDTIIDNGVTKGIHNYTIISKNSMIEKMELSINQKFKMLSKVIYHYNSEAGLNSTKVIIEYKGITSNPSFTTTEFNEKQYILKNKGELIPSLAYKGYEIIEITSSDLND